MSASTIEYEDIDIMSDSLSFLGEDVSELEGDGEVRYGELILRIPPKASKCFAELFARTSTVVNFSIGRQGPYRNKIDTGHVALMKETWYRRH